MVEERARSGNAERSRESLAPRLRDENHVRLVEIAPEPGSTAFEVATRVSARELLEEVLDEVLLGELLDDLDFLDADGDLARDSPAELDPGAALRDEQPDELAVRNEGNGQAGTAAAARELRAELRQAKGRTSTAGLRVARLQVELLTRRVEQVDVACPCRE